MIEKYFFWFRSVAKYLVNDLIKVKKFEFVVTTTSKSLKKNLKGRLIFH